MNRVSTVALRSAKLLEPGKSIGPPAKEQYSVCSARSVKAISFATINLDLIYGAYDKPLSSWLHSVQDVIRYMR